MSEILICFLIYPLVSEDFIFLHRYNLLMYKRFLNDVGLMRILVGKIYIHTDTANSCLVGYGLSNGLG